MENMPILSILIMLPLVGALLIFAASRIFAGYSAAAIKLSGLSVTILNFIFSLYVWQLFDPQVADLQLTERMLWLAEYNILYALGIDGISIFFILLTTLLLPICMLASWHAIQDRVAYYVITFLALESLLLGVFCAADLLLFYVFFEAVLIPMFLIIGIWGGERRVYAAFKFFLYTLLGSVLMLIALLYIYTQTNTMDIVMLGNILPQQTLRVQQLLWLAFFASFAVKVPMWPFHTWLPDAHVQAPTAGSVILAGVMLKLGGYGFLRLSIPLFPSASLYFADFIFHLSIIAVIYTSCVALVQDDMKKLVAYSSVAHMGFVTAGLFSFTTQGMEGAVFQMLSHGVVSAALFLCVGVLYDRMHTKEIRFYNGLTDKMPNFALVFMLFTLASIGLPGTSGFVGEFMVLNGVFQMDKTYAALLALGLVLGAAYMLWLYKRTMFGEMTNAKLKKIYDLMPAERIMLLPIVILVIVLGVCPNLVTQNIATAINKVRTSALQAEAYEFKRLDKVYEDMNWIDEEYE